MNTIISSSLAHNQGNHSGPPNSDQFALKGGVWQSGCVFEWFGGGAVAVYDGEVWYLVTHLASRTAHVTLIAHKNRGKVSGGVIRQVEGQLYRRTNHLPYKLKYHGWMAGLPARLVN